MLAGKSLAHPSDMKAEVAEKLMLLGPKEQKLKSVPMQEPAQK